jgi:ABC-type nitrate/sulfonate/bicarbonate transport system permease component
LNTILGIKSVDRGYREVLISVNASRWQAITQLNSSSLPYILTGMEIGIVCDHRRGCWRISGRQPGLGNLAVKEMNSYNTTALFAVIIHLSLLGLSSTRSGRNAAVRLPWHDPFKSTAVILIKSRAARVVETGSALGVNPAAWSAKLIPCGPLAPQLHAD